MGDLRQPLPVRTPEGDFAPSVIPWVVVGYIVILFAGAVVLRLPLVTVAGNELSHTEALFESVNTLTLSGLKTQRPASTYTVGGQGILLGLTLLGLWGGMFITATALTRIAKMGYSDRQVLTSIVGYSVLATLIGAVALVAPHRSVFQSISLALGVFSHGGVSFGSVPGVMAWRMHGVLVPLAVLGGLGIPVLMELSDWITRRRDRLSWHSRTVIGLAAGVYLLGMLLTVVTWGATGTEMGWGELLGSASVGTVMGGGVGLGALELYRLPDAVLWVLAAVMLVGSAPSGSGSGLRTTTLAVLVRPIRALWNTSPRQPAASPAVGVALIWAGGLALLTGAVFVGLMLLAPLMPADRALFNAISATTHTGPGLELGTLSPSVSILLSLAMLMARIIPWVLIWALVPRARAAEVAVP